MAKSSARPYRIVWAVDPFGDPDSLALQMARTLKAIMGNRKFQVQPVYMLSLGEMGFSDSGVKVAANRYRPAAENALRNLFGRLGLPVVLEPKVLIRAESRIRSSARAVAKFAERENADLLLFATHGKKGLERLMLGSFAEALLQMSRTPMLILGPRSQDWGEDGSQRRLLYATDLSQASKTGFHSLLKFASAFGFSVEVVYVLMRPAGAALQASVYLLSGGHLPMPLYFQDQRERAEKELQKWKKIAETQSVRLTVRIEDTPGEVSKTLLQIAESQKFQMISLTSRSGPLSSVLIGSVTREVLRNSIHPVWVLHTKE